MPINRNDLWPLNLRECIKLHKYLHRVIHTLRDPAFVDGVMHRAQDNRARVGSKSWLIGQLMLRPGGTTASEAMRVTRWPSVSMVQQARICGLELVTQRTGRTVRFYAR
jgi:hypothetical protein